MAANANTPEVSTVQITLTKSISGRKKDQIATAVSLGLTKIGKTVSQPNNAATQGKIHKISHLIKVN